MEMRRVHEIVVTRKEGAYCSRDELGGRKEL